MAPPRILTIGVYGYDEDEFFAALQEAGVDLFCDIRLRRGVRGAQYAFANSQRLQARLEEMGIAYLHRKDLAPTKEIRSLQFAADDAKKVAKRQRDTLSPRLRRRLLRADPRRLQPVGFCSRTAAGHAGRRLLLRRTRAGSLPSVPGGRAIRRRARHGSGAYPMKVFIVAKTRRGSGACIGAVTDSGRSLRLMPPEREREKTGFNCEYNIGEIWWLDDYEFPSDEDLVPPHVEDVIVRAQTPSRPQ